MKLFVSIPQAVSTVATKVFELVGRAVVGGVSIPQAVSTVATGVLTPAQFKMFKDSFNTASGKYCCN